MTTPSQVILITSDAFAIDPRALLSDIRAKEVVLARHVAALLLTTKLQLSSTQAGEQLGGRDHTTILHALKSITRKRKEDATLDALILSLETNLDLMERLKNLGVISMLALARTTSNSRRNAMGLTVDEIMGLAHSLLEVWEIAEASNVLAKCIIGNALPDTIHEIAVNIRDQFIMITEQNPVEKQENGNV